MTDHPFRTAATDQCEADAVTKYIDGVDALLAQPAPPLGTPTVTMPLHTAAHIADVLRRTRDADEPVQGGEEPVTDEEDASPAGGFPPPYEGPDLGGYLRGLAADFFGLGTPKAERPSFDDILAGRVPPMPASPTWRAPFVDPEAKSEPGTIREPGTYEPIGFPVHEGAEETAFDERDLAAEIDALNAFTAELAGKLDDIAPAELSEVEYVGQPDALLDLVASVQDDEVVSISISRSGLSVTSSEDEPSIHEEERIAAARVAVANAAGDVRETLESARLYGSENVGRHYVAKLTREAHALLAALEVEGEILAEYGRK